MKVGLIGLKGHVSYVMQGARDLGGCEVVAVSDDDMRAAAGFVGRERLARRAQTYGDWRHLIEHTLMDVCVVCDENGRRPEQLIALAQRGVHIVTEKPLATTLEDLGRVREALEKSKSRLTMLLTMRHEPKYLKMRELVRSGAVGTVCLATAQKSYRLGDRPEWQKSRERLGGTIPFIGIHALDLVRWVSGQDFTHVAGFHGNLGKPEFGESEDHASLALRLANGGSVTSRLDYLRPAAAPTHGDDRLRIAGSEGVVEVMRSFPEVSLVTTEKAPHRVEPGESENLFVDFARSLEGGHAARISEDDALYITEVVLRARDAADRREMVSIPPLRPLERKG